MRVLMFGWEFPPHISDGLGTACFRITKGLTQLGTEIIFVRLQFHHRNACLKQFHNRAFLLG